mmetsp:Transcript_101587/g.291609  ORF Transcript_101587/g.291609 Transcript_101587/m.291609 type:complete len:409 (-) Transcript_101587:375-1601(-)
MPLGQAPAQALCENGAAPGTERCGGGAKGAERGGLPQSAPEPQHPARAPRPEARNDGRGTPGANQSEAKSSKGGGTQRPLLRLGPPSQAAPGNGAGTPGCKEGSKCLCVCVPLPNGEHRVDLPLANGGHEPAPHPAPRPPGVQPAEQGLLGAAQQGLPGGRAAPVLHPAEEADSITLGDPLQHHLLDSRSSRAADLPVAPPRPHRAAKQNRGSELRADLPDNTPSGALACTPPPSDKYLQSQAHMPIPAHRGQQLSQRRCACDVRSGGCQAKGVYRNIRLGVGLGLGLLVLLLLRQLECHSLPMAQAASACPAHEPRERQREHGARPVRRLPQSVAATRLRSGLLHSWLRRRLRDGHPRRRDKQRRQVFRRVLAGAAGEKRQRLLLFATPRTRRRQQLKRSHRQQCRR